MLAVNMNNNTSPVVYILKHGTPRNEVEPTETTHYFKIQPKPAQKIFPKNLSLAPPVRPNLVTRFKKCFDFYENWHNKQLNDANFIGDVGI